MGNFYTNFTVRSADATQVADALRTMGRVAYVAPVLHDSTVAFDRECEEQDVNEIGQVGVRLSLQLETTVLAVLVHDDDVLYYWLYQFGRLIDEYNSCPSYFDETAEPEGPAGGNAEALCEAFGCPQRAGKVSAILQKSSFDEDGYVFAVDRHRDLVEAMDLPHYAVGTGYHYIGNNELPQGLDRNDWIDIG